MEIKLRSKIEYNNYRLGRALRKDWNVFIRDVCHVHLDRDQQRIVSSVQFNSRTSVRSGTARGKDFAAAWACFCFFALTPEFTRNKVGALQLTGNTKVAMTAPTDRQIKNIMFPEISKIFKTVKTRAPGMCYPVGMRAVGYDIRTRWEEWFLTGFKADDNNIEAWSGFHAANVMFAVTEASGMNEKVFETIEGNLQGNSRILLVFNPNKPVGYAAKSTKLEGWTKFKLSSIDSPNVTEKKIIIPGQVDYAWVKDKVKTQSAALEKSQVIIEKNDFEFEDNWYRPTDWFRIKVLGEFPETSTDTLIPLSWIEAAEKRWAIFHHEKRLINSPLRLGVDVAGMGNDDSVLISRYGDFVSEIKNYNAGGVANHMQTAGETKTRLKKGGDAALIDTIGEGAGVYSRLQELNQNVYSVKSNASAKGLVDMTKEYTFGNLRDYLFWAIRDWLNPVYNSGSCLPKNDKLREELTETKWGYDSQGRPTIEKKDGLKKRLGRSPDCADALALSFYPESKMKGFGIPISRISGIY